MTRRVGAAVVSLLLVVSVLAAIPGLAGAQQQSGKVIGRPDLSFSASTGELAPGTNTELSISVTNRGQINSAGPSNYESRVTTARGVTLTVDDSDVPIDVQSGTIAAGNIPTGSVPTEAMPLRVSGNAEPGTYEVPVEYEYDYTYVADYDGSSVEYQDRTRTGTAEMEIVVRDQAQFEIVETDSETQVGDTGDVSVTLQNTGGGTATDATVTAASRSGSLSFDGGGEESAASIDGTWEPGENRTTTYTAAIAPDAPERTYAAGLTVSFTDAKGIDRTSAVRTLQIPTAGEQTFAFENVSTSLHVGEEGTVSGTVVNTGPQTAGSVVVQYADNSSSFVPIEQTTAVGALEPDESASFSLPVEVISEARSGTKSISFAVRYRNADDDRRRYGTIDVTADVGQERNQFEVAMTNRTISAGGSRTVTVEATNNLDETVTDVQARLFADDPLSTGDNNEGYVQSIEPGETVTLTYELSASSGATAGKTYPASMDFRYDDERGNSHLSNTVRVPIDVTSEESGGLPIGTIALVGLVLVGVGAVVRYRGN